MLGLLVYLIGWLFSGRKMAAWYVWGPRAVSPEDLHPRLMKYDPERSLIHLRYIDNVLVIDMVQRGSAWVPTSFCSVMLPATIRDFFARLDVTIESDVEAIYVVNSAEPRAAGCKCYARTMIELGFKSINGEIYDSHIDYCNTATDPRRDMMIGMIPAELLERTSSGQNDENQIALLREAKQKYLYVASIHTAFA